MCSDCASSELEGGFPARLCMRYCGQGHEMQKTDGTEAETRGLGQQRPEGSLNMRFRQ